MRQSQLFAKTKKIELKEAQSVSHQLLLRGDFIEQIASGVYSFLPLGFKVLKKIENIIREEMEKIGGQEVFMPALVPENLWRATERWEKIDPPLFKLKDRHGKYFGLGSTHEEVFTELAKTRIQSYRDLPQFLFQIQNKFRNEIRPCSGLLRTREFVMKDLYSFHATEKEAKEFYNKVQQIYLSIFKRCGLPVVCVEADPGTIGGSLSHEFAVPAQVGEDRIMVCRTCKFSANIEKLGEQKKCHCCKEALEEQKVIEAGHTFYLGDKYSKDMDLKYLDREGKSHFVLMGCYGIGLGRLMATIVELNHDAKGIVWPSLLAPFDISLIPIEQTDKVKKVAEKLYADLQKAGREVLYDDRQDKTAGEKFADADLIGLPWRIIISERTLKEKSVELKRRDEQKAKILRIEELQGFLAKKL